MKYLKAIFLFLLLVLLGQPLISQKHNENRSYVDSNGVLRWSGNHSEIKGFGINYTVPFAHAYRMAKRLGISPKEAIKQDVYHFSRLDFDLYRVHIWDTEISDTLGNLIENEHLDLFDFMVYEMKQRGMKFVITPIAFWGNGWPEPDEKTPGFSHKYGKEACLTNPHAIEAQVNYLNQFLKHVNPYTKVAYKDEADIIAFEISNEPHHQGTVKEITGYINKMVKSMRKTGTATPIFYNMSHSINSVDAYLNADVQGGTFQWYPTGLVAKHQLKGNFLPAVDNYDIPFADNPKFKSMAKIVYEFDPADVGGNYMYPAMARSFRKANMQLATHFAYDALFLAPYNTNYGTHYMNLAYAPQKAISLKIASAVFHDVPMGSDFGSYPDNTRFSNFAISQQDDLVELVSDTRFFYSNNTTSRPENVDSIQEICGYKSSPLVQYDGLGAYFLDRIEPEVWRLELMPDAYWLRDPYAPTSPKNQVAAVNHNWRQMSIHLPSLGSEFTVRAIDPNSPLELNANDYTINIKPGVYILTNKNTEYDIHINTPYKNITLGEYVAPKSNLSKVVLKSDRSDKYTANDTSVIRFEVISPNIPLELSLILHGEFGTERLLAKQEEPGVYVVNLTGNVTRPGRVDYSVDIKFEDGWCTYPLGLKGKSTDWDNNYNGNFTIDFVEEGVPLVLWDAVSDWDNSIIQWNKGIRISPNPRTGEPALCYHLKDEDENTDADIQGTTDLLNTFKFYFKDRLKGQLDQMALKNELVLIGSALNDAPCFIEIGLVDGHGNTFTYTLELNQVKDEYRIALERFVKDDYAILPRPFPGFLPFYFKDGRNEPLDLNALETLQISVVSGTKRGAKFYLSNVRLD